VSWKRIQWLSAFNRSATRIDMTEPTQSEFALTYAKDKGSARVYVAFAMAALFAGFWMLNGHKVVLLFGVLAFGVSFYFYPLVETGRHRMGAGEHGIFIEGFGLIPWRSVEDVSLSTHAVRSIQVNELHIKLSRALPSALSADWRSLPPHRLLMMLPWKMGADNVVRVNLEPFPGSPADIVTAFQRNWRFFGK